MRASEPTYQRLRSQILPHSPSLALESQFLSLFTLLLYGYASFRGPNSALFPMLVPWDQFRPHVLELVFIHLQEVKHHLALAHVRSAELFRWMPPYVVPGHFACKNNRTLCLSSLFSFLPGEVYKHKVQAAYSFGSSLTW